MDDWLLPQSIGKCIWQYYIESQNSLQHCAQLPTMLYSDRGSNSSGLRDRESGWVFLKCKIKCCKLCIKYEMSYSQKRHSLKALTTMKQVLILMASLLKTESCPYCLFQSGFLTRKSVRISYLASFDLRKSASSFYCCLIFPVTDLTTSMDVIAKWSSSFKDFSKPTLFLTISLN